MDTLLAFFIGLGAGILYYFYDFKQMIGTYRKWYALTHKDPLPEDNDQGFVYGQPFSGKLYSAAFLALVITGIIILTGSANILVQLLYGAFITVGLLLAFYISPLIFRHAPTKLEALKGTLKKMDDLEAEMGMSDKKLPENKTEPLPPPPAQPEPQKKTEEKKDDKDWRKGIKKYLDD